MLVLYFRTRFLDIVDGRVPKSQMTMMKDISLRGRTDVSQERVVNKLQDWVYDDVLSQFVMLPQVSVIRVRQTGR